ncbi:MAG: hypothetical protein H0V66_06160 [Bdellovibrionales bacterium]|nr:hypothetical protein [Bdellovibrionales bacterium]
MEKETPKIRVIDQQSGQTLFECSLQDSEKAYQFAAQMEEMGLDLKVIVPTLSATLSQSLGLTRDEQIAYEASLEEEMEEHEGSCCFTDNDPNKTLN